MIVHEVTGPVPGIKEFQSGEVTTGPVGDAALTGGLVVNFPVPFSAIPTVSIGIRYVDVQGTLSVECITTNVSADSFTLIAGNFGGSGPLQSVVVTWFAYVPDTTIPTPVRPIFPEGQGP